MRKFFFIAIGALVAALVAGMGIFYWQNLRGVGPVIFPPPEDIGEIIEKSLPSAQNNTDFPLKLPDGFSVSIFAEDVGPARVLAMDPAGNLLASITKEDKVIALPDSDRDGKADAIVTVAQGLDRPHGLAFRCERGCRLYIAEQNQVAVYDYNALELEVTNKIKILDLPAGGSHFTRTIMFLPDGSLLTSVGSSCNVCHEKDWRRAKVLVSNSDGSDLRVFASGLRNAVFMALHPFTKEVWVTEMGRDLLGDDLPPDEINIIEEGDPSTEFRARNYGWPICYGKNIHDTDFDQNTYVRNPCMEPFEMPSSIDVPAHSAPLGLAFFPREGWPEEYHDDLLVAYHGSWNRTIPTGYKIVRYKLDEQGNYQGEADSTGSPLGEDFISGWLTEDNRALGRPVDILIQPNGTMYISDDKAGVIYRIHYQNPF